jgi:hypothetical protein
MPDETPTPRPGGPIAPRKRRPKFKPTRDRRVVIRDRDRELFKLFLLVRLATVDDLYPLLREHFPSPFVLWRRMQGLFHAPEGYLARPAQQQLRRYPKRGEPLQVYALGNGGAHELEQLGVTLPKMDWNQTAKAFKVLSLDHALLTTHAVAVILASVRAQPELRVRRVLPDGAFHTSVTAYDGERNVRIPIKPDAVLIVEEIKKRQTTAFLLEADRSTMPAERTTLAQSSFRRKALGYFTYWLDKATLRRELEADDFVVLTVCRTTSRLEALRATAQQVDPKKIGTNIFWFTTVDALRRDTPETAVTDETIWTTAAGKTGALF